MRITRIAVSIILGLASLGMLIWAFAPQVGASRLTSSGDPDLPPSRQGLDKKEFLAHRNAWTMLRRGYDPDRPFDPHARDRAIEQMGRQLNQLEANRRSLGPNSPDLSANAWTPVGPAPIPMGQTENRVDPVTGRIISLAIHPTNPDIVFVGTAGGGLYRTLNGQAANPTWTPLMDTIQTQGNGIAALGTLAIGAIAIAPSNPDIVYIGTGEQFTGYFGSGLYRIDNATTANPTLVGPINPSANYGDGVVPTFTFRGISQILVHPTAPGTIFVSTSPGKGGISTHNDSNPPGNVPPSGLLGIYRSTNATSAAGTISFTKLRVNGSGGFANGNTDISDMVLDPGDASANTLIAWVRNGGGVADACAADCAGVYRSTNAAGAATFTQQLISNNGDTRGELAINRVGTTTTIVAATGEAPPVACATAASHLGRLRRSVDGGVTWPGTDVAAATDGGLIRAGDGFCGGQCFYDIGVAMDPGNASLIQIGGSGNYAPGCNVLTRRSTNGVALTDNSTGLHADVHVFAVAASNSAIVWTGNDGGLWRSTDSGATWTSMNGDPAVTTNPTGKISASQYVSIATHPVDREYMTGGTQDNGTHLKRAAGDTGAWTQIAFGDGGYTAIDQNATDTTNVTVYHTYFNLAGAMAQITYERVQTTADAKTKNWTTFNCVAGGAGNTKIDCADTAVSFYAPMVLGPGNPNTLYFGTDRLYRSADSGTTMQLVSQGPIIGGGGVEVTSISVGLGNDNVRLVGMRNGTVWATTTGSTTLTNVTPAGAPAGVTVGKVLVDPNNTDPNAITAYIAYGGFGTAGNPITHLWKTTNLAGGAGTWVAVSNGLPDIPIDAIAVDKKSATAPAAGTSVYLGTDIGVYRSTDGGANWAIYNPGNTLPVLPVFDMAFQEQGGTGNRILRIATHGRGIWEIQTTGGIVVPTTLGNISGRMRVDTGDNVLIGGFIITGTQPKKVIVRGIGPSLPVAGKLTNPILELHSATALLSTNDNWGDAPNAQEIINSTVAPQDAMESAILTTLAPGRYTAIVRGVGGETGVGLMDIYDLDRTSNSTLANISCRGFVQTDPNALFGGFILVGNQTKRVIVRAIGPSLTVPGKLADPTLELFNRDGVMIGSNDNWRSTQEAEIMMTGVAPTDDLESAIVATLPPTPHTVIVRGKNGTSGVGLVEIYTLP